MSLILASQSPYRRELLNRLKVPFECINSKLDEVPYKKEIDDPKYLSEKLAYLKAKKVWDQRQDSIVIGSDQVCVLGEKKLSKPKTFEKACEQIQELSGKTHQLYTSVSIITAAKDISWTDTTNLTMRELTDSEIIDYVKQDDPLMCAGSYKIESLGISLFSRIDTQDFTAITGLPLIMLSEYLRELL